MRKLSIEDWTKFLFLSNPRFDSRGRDFVISVKKADFTNNDYINRLYLYRKGKFTKFGGKRDFNPKWSPKNDKIAFLRKKKSEKKKTFLCIWDIKTDSIDEIKLEKEINDFEWYDSKSFVLLCNEKSEDREDGIYEAAGEIPFFSNAEGFIAGNRKKLFKYANEKLSCLTPENLTVESFKVIKKKVYFIARERDKMEENPMIYDVYVLENKKAKKLTSSDKIIMDFEIKNDNLICVASDFEYGLVTSARLFLTELKTMKTKKYLNEPFVSLGNSVNSDSRGSTRFLKATRNYIYCEGTKKDRAVLYKVDYSGNYEIIEKDHSFDDFDVNEDGEILFVKNSSTELPNLYLMSNGREKRLKKFNVNNFYVSTPEKFEVKGRKIDAWIMKPIDFEEGKKYPAILEIHGGPKTVYGEGFMFEFQLLSSLGYVVIYSNPFGSDGYGQEFGDLRGRYGTTDYEDLMAVVDSALEKFDFIDEEHLGVTGGSYGGFMTNWIIGHTDRFKAAVTQRSISNWTSMFGISDIGYFFTEDHIGKTPWENPDEYFKKSPLSYAKNFKTPTLIIHSREDYRCPVAEGYQLFTALRYNKIESRMVLFESENHDLSRKGKPKQKTRRLIEIVNWFDKYLKEKR